MDSIFELPDAGRSYIASVKFYLDAGLPPMIQDKFRYLVLNWSETAVDNVSDAAIHFKNVFETGVHIKLEVFSKSSWEPASKYIARLYPNKVDTCVQIKRKPVQK